MPCCGGDNDNDTNETRTAADEVDYGEALKYDKNFTGPLSKRSCTDVLCLLIFIVFLGCWGFVGFYAVTHGDLDKLLVPTDSEGRKCGIDNGVIDKPYLVFFNIEKCIDPSVPLYGCRTPQVCVQSCPNISFYFNVNDCKRNFIDARNKLICRTEVDVTKIQSCDQIDTLVNRDMCVQWYLPSTPFLKRCIWGLASGQCPNIPKRYLQQLRSRGSRTLRNPPANNTYGTLGIYGSTYSGQSRDSHDGRDLQEGWSRRDGYQEGWNRRDGSQDAWNRRDGSQEGWNRRDGWDGRSNINFPGQFPPSGPEPHPFAANQPAQNEPKAACEERRELGTQILIKKAEHVDSTLSRFVGNFIMLFSNQTTSQEMGQMIVEDVMETWLHILIGLLIAMFSCLILIAMMRWMATPLVWLSVLGIIGCLGFATYYCFTKFLYLRNRAPTDVNIHTNLSKIADTWLQKPNTWLYSGIAAAVALIIILLVVLVLRKRIVIAIALVKEGSKAVSSITSTVFFPIFPWIFQLAIIAFAIMVGLYLASIGTPVNQVVRMSNDTSCVCNGLASHYQDGVPCDPRVFNQYCVNTDDAQVFNYAPVTKVCKVAACNFKEIASPTIVTYFQVLNVFGFFWVVFFITAFGEMVLASTFATWYWTFRKSNVPFFTLSYGLGRTIRYHLGTLAFGSLIITICRMIRVVLEYIDQKLKKYDNEVTRCILCCMKCFFWCLEKFLRFMSKNAYIMCAIHGKPFCTSARDAFNLLMRNFLRVVALDKVTEFLFFLTKVCVTIGMGAVTYYYFTNADQFSQFWAPVQLHYVQVPVIIVMIGTYLIASVFFSVYSMAVDTLFMCFLEDCERNDGSEEKPYFMSKQLMKILGKKNLVPRDQYN